MEFQIIYSLYECMTCLSIVPYLVAIVYFSANVIEIQNIQIKNSKN